VQGDAGQDDEGVILQQNKIREVGFLANFTNFRKYICKVDGMFRNLTFEIKVELLKKHISVLSQLSKDGHQYRHRYLDQGLRDGDSPGSHPSLEGLREVHEAVLERSGIR